MASVSSSHLILFIASLLIAASVAGTFTQGVERLSSALGDRSVDVSSDVRTDVEIISDPASGAVYDESESAATVTLLVKNTGSRDLDSSPDRIDVLVDGRYQTSVSTVVVDGSSWGVGNVLRVEVGLSSTLAEGDHQAKVIVEGDEEVLRFRT
ncbi:flagellar protein G [Halorussus halobius]|uniref:flagellar protein G n=1 Tax=Halorussus halobius TaxID=1710537 RepID=UPI0010930B89|nr:flagellar protein G [Halorussus halobius]